MIYQDLLLSLQKIFMLVSVTYFASRTEAFARLLLQISRPRDKALSFLFFSSLALGEVVLSPHNSLIDARIVSATAAGLLGGAWLGLSVGISTGALSALHSPWIPSDSLPPIIAGLLGGSIYLYRTAFASKVLAGFLVGALSHGLWLAIRSQRDFFVASWDALAVQYMLPTVLSGVGVSLFLVIVGDMRAQRQRIERSELARAIGSANRTLPGLGSGLNEATAAHVAEMVRSLAGVPAAAIAIPGKLLAHAGEAAAYHLESGFIPEVALKAMEDGRRHQTENRATWCTYPGCPFGSASAGPLSYNGRVIGSVILFANRGTKLRPEVIDVGCEVAQFLTSYQMEADKAERQAIATSRAELKALQAQMHPHFLFNALNTLAAMCEIEPQQAARLTGKLGEFLRRSLRSERQMLSTLEEELVSVETYLDIEQTRFRNRLEISREINQSCLDCLVPSFTLQPIVENAVLHGVSMKTGKGHLRIVARGRKDRVLLAVLDDGRGFDTGTINWHGNGSHALPMLRRRLEKIYGRDFRLRIRSSPGRGTLALLWLPTSRQTQQIYAP